MGNAGKEKNNTEKMKKLRKYSRFKKTGRVGKGEKKI